MLNIGHTDSFSFNSIQQRIVKFLRNGKSETLTGKVASAPGIDCGPVKNSIAITAVTKTGETIVLGYLNKEQKADVGEIRIAAFDADGVEQSYVWWKNDGNILFNGDNDNLVRYSKLETAFNQLKSDFNTFVNTYNAHTHTSAAPGSPTATPSSPGVTSNADIAPAKINELKTNNGA